MYFLEKTGKIQANPIFENQNRAEGFIWQEIGSKIRKVCEILVHPVGVTLYLNRKTVKDRRNRLYIRNVDGFAVNFWGPNLFIFDNLRKISHNGQFARIFWQIGH